MRQNMKNLGILAFFLVLGAGSLALAKDLPCKPERWKKAIARFEAADQENLPSHGGIVFVGSSSIVLWDLPKSFPKLEAINRGFGGSEICDSTYYAEILVIKHRPRTIVFYAGDNDIARGKTADQVHRDFLAFRDTLFQALPDTRLLYVAIKPSRARWDKSPQMQTANTQIAAECKADDRLTFIDIWKPMLHKGGMPAEHWFRKDGLHLSDAGYDLWNSLLKPHLETADH